ncbi:helix-turn-helix domain-containing protein [Sebaldella sp. S0638]|uniref:helix-turn-helix domain-containing protein n=1 Tax=Sebaldella sp. S0638 TaxID=2957809 RepID=UPI00209ED2DC|nr:helix-turn-helix transcriptional regulator [Sebaldella sp. S0638]MCP1224649.1 helix-turn-helix transcriptional regulator [Sebaldella sp. S0638]
MKFKEYKEKVFKGDPELYEEYKKLEPEYELIKQVIKIRNDQKLTQQQLAERTGTKQSNISRFEKGEYNPSLKFLKKLARGLGKELHIEFR